MKTITKDFEARTAYESPSILVVEMKTATVLCQSNPAYFEAVDLLDGKSNWFEEEE